MSNINNIAKIVDKLNGDNLLFSPLSLNFALALISEGVEDKKEFEEYFGISYDEYINFYSNYKGINIANALYIRKGLELNKNFRDKLGTEISIEEFDSKFVKKVNKWVSKKTNKMILYILEEEPKDSDAIIINALYFENEWAEEYKPRQIDNGYFFIDEDTYSKVKYLKSIEFTYFENDYATGFSKSYKNERFSFIGILPKEEGEFTIESLDIDSLLKSKIRIETHVKIPEFEFDNSHILTDKVDIDFGVIPNIVEGPLVSPEILQKTKIKLDRYGTKAAAVTSVHMIGALPMGLNNYKEVELIRPFAFMIYDNENNTPLFIGKVIDPTD